MINKEMTVYSCCCWLIFFPLPNIYAFSKFYRCSKQLERILFQEAIGTLWDVAQVRHSFQTSQRYNKTSVWPKHVFHCFPCNFIVFPQCKYSLKIFLSSFRLFFICPLAFLWYLYLLSIYHWIQSVSPSSYSI